MKCNHLRIGREGGKRRVRQHVERGYLSLALRVNADRQTVKRDGATPPDIKYDIND